MSTLSPFHISQLSGICQRVTFTVNLDPQSQSSDDQLVALAKAGSVQGLSGLYQQYVTQVYRFFYWHTESDDQAEDLTHTVFVEVAKSIRSFSGKSKFRTWLFGVCKIQLAKWWRVNQPTLSLDEWTEYLAQASQNEPASEFEIDQSSLISDEQTSIKQKLVAFMLNQLKPIEKKVLTAHYLEALPFKQVATKYKISLTNAKVIAHRAIQKLEAQFKK